MLKDTENDDFEPSDITDSLGGFALNIIARDSATFSKVILKTDSNEGCVDSFTNTKPGMLTLRAPMDASVITPLTTVAIEIASVYLITVERAAELILESIGLAEESIDSDLIFKIDPFQKLVIDGDDSIATVAYASVNVANAISMISSLLYGAGTSSKAEAEAATLLAFAKRIGDTNIVLRKKRRILLEKYTKSLIVSDSSDISSIISSAVSVVSRTSPDVRVDTAAKNAVAQASASASSYLLSTNTTSDSYSGEAISKICAAAVKVLQDGKRERIGRHSAISTASVSSPSSPPSFDDSGDPYKQRRRCSVVSKMDDMVALVLNSYHRSRSVVVICVVLVFFVKKERELKKHSNITNQK